MLNNQTNFMLEYTHYNTMRERCPSWFQYVMVGDLKSSHHLDYDIDINRYLTKSTTLN
jgi:hypothetical protein